MSFQALEYKERNFMDLNDNDNQHICPTYTKEGAWLKYFGLFNLICVWIIRLITNHAPTGKYKLRFFLKEFIAYSCRSYSIKMRRYILFECLRFKKL